MVADHVDGMRPSGRHVYTAVLAGLPLPEIEKQIRIGRARGVNGFAFYPYSVLTSRGGISYLANGPFREPAGPPRMDWLR